MRTSGLAALVAGLAIAAMPATAQAQDGRDGWHRGGEARPNRGGNGNGGGWRQREAPAQPAAPAPQARAQVQVEAQAAPAPRNPGGDRGGGGFWRGGGGQRTDGGNRPDGGQRYGRDWANGGAVNRPAPAQEAARGTPSYADPARNRSYSGRGQAQQGWDGQRWNGQNTDRTAGWTWDRNRDGRPDSRTADGRRWDGNRDGRGWDGNRDGRAWDGNRDRRGWNGDRDGRRWDGNRGGWNGSRQGNWSRDWRRDNRYNWQAWRNSNRDIFRVGRYYSPYRDYSYRRLSIGFYLDNLFYSQNYWINDPYEYRLPPADGPYRWVRYYDDALLVNVYDGEVVDVIYDFFW